MEQTAPERAPGWEHIVSRLVAERGWEDTTTAAGVLANWDKLVGPEIADHSRPESLVEGKYLCLGERGCRAHEGCG